MRIDELEQAVRLVMEEAKAGDEDAAWRGVQSLLREQHVQESVALALAAILEGAHLPTEKALTVLAEVYGAHRGNESVIGPLGSDKHVVMGRIAAPRELDVRELLTPSSSIGQWRGASLVESTHRIFARLLGLQSAPLSKDAGSK